MQNSGNALGVPVGRNHEHGEGSIYVISEPGDPLLAPKRNLDRLSLFNPEGATDHGPIGDLEVAGPLSFLRWRPDNLSAEDHAAGFALEEVFQNSKTTLSADRPMIQARDILVPWLKRQTDNAVSASRPAEETASMRVKASLPGTARNPGAHSSFAG